jgi:Bacterial Ig domain
MFAPSKIKVGARAVALALALATSSFSAHAVLQRAGPVNVAPSVGGFPSWYQDTTGISMEFCDPRNVAELNGGWCVLLPGPIGPVPEVFPNNFFIEHFYFDANTLLTTLSGGKARIILAQEASFFNGFFVVPGEQMTFARIRLFFTGVSTTGTYRIIHPYGEELLHGVAGDRIFFTDDVGIGCMGDFTCALKSRLGPFLLPSATPGGPEDPALTATNLTPDTNPAHFGGAFAPTPYPGTGSSYINDPRRIGPVTGSALPNFIDSTGASRNHNIFRIEGPAGSLLGVDPVSGAQVDWIETTNFALGGRLFTGTMPGAATVDRASYTRNAIGQKVDVLATGVPSTGARLPAAPAVPQVTPTLTFFGAPCAGTVDPVTGAILPPFSAPLGVAETQMLSTGQQYWGQIQPAVLPISVCLKNGNARDAAGNLIVTFEPHVVTDEVTITNAAYDLAAGTLTVAATSSDTTVPPVLTVTYNGFTGPLAAGQIVVPNILVPPANVTVESSALGSNAMLVTTSFPAPPPPTGPVATADSFTFLEDSGPHILSILANDLNAVGGTVTLTSVPSKGTAVVNLDGTVTYTSILNANGADTFTYTVTVGTLVSGTATVSLNITPVNDPPVAVNDTAVTSVNVPIAINVLANDLDVDGVTNPTMGLVTGPGFLAGAANVSALTPATGASITSVVGGTVNFLATTAGTYTFTYQARDDANALSVNTATVTVTVQAAEAIVINKDQFTLSTKTLQVSGTVTPAPLAADVITFSFLNSAGVVIGSGGTFTLAAGRTAYAYNSAPGMTLPVGAVSLRATTAAGAVSNVFPLTLK